MPKYIITPKAGRFVAGYRNPGAGRAIDMPAHAAAYELLLGTLRLADEPASREPVPAQAPKSQSADDEVGDKASKKKR